MNLPQPCPLPHSVSEFKMPYVIVADEAFPLFRNVMRPYILVGQRDDYLSTRRFSTTSITSLIVRWCVFPFYLNWVIQVVQSSPRSGKCVWIVGCSMATTEIWNKFQTRKCRELHKSLLCASQLPTVGWQIRS
jgi:hypothetical protein